MTCTGQVEGMSRIQQNFDKFLLVPFRGTRKASCSLSIATGAVNNDTLLIPGQ